MLSRGAAAAVVSLIASTSVSILSLPSRVSALETYVNLQQPDGGLIQVELRHACCDEIASVSDAFCGEFQIPTSDCIQLGRFLQTGKADCSCDGGPTSPPTQTTRKKKLGNFSLKLLREGGSHPDPIKLAIHEGDFMIMDSRVDGICGRFSVDDSACGNLREALRKTSLQLEMQSVTETLQRVATMDSTAVGTAVAKFEVLVDTLVAERERLLQQLDEKAEAFRSLDLESKRERHQMERRLRNLERKVVTDQGDEAVTKARLHTKPLTIPRVHASNFSYSDYLRYARSSTPVIIQGLANEPGSPGLPPWTLSHLNATCGEATVTLKRPVSSEDDGISSSQVWAGIKPVTVAPLHHFLRDFDASTSVNWPAGFADLYLHDASISSFCPALLRTFSVPRYFVDDKMQLLPSRFKQRDYWPSLFIGDATTASTLHGDWGHTAAWMGLVQGRKHWAIAKPTARAALFEDMSTASAATAARFNSSVLGEKKLVDLLQPGEVYEAVLEAGEVIFIPADCPHQVQNLEKTVAVAVNYVDSANFEGFKASMRHRRDTSTGDEYRKYAHDLELLEKLSSPQMDDATAVDLPFDEFKRREQRGL